MSVVCHPSSVFRRLGAFIEHVNNAAEGRHQGRQHGYDKGNDKGLCRGHAPQREERHKTAFANTDAINGHRQYDEQHNERHEDKVIRHRHMHPKAHGNRVKNQDPQHLHESGKQERRHQRLRILPVL